MASEAKNSEIAVEKLPVWRRESAYRRYSERSYSDIIFSFENGSISIDGLGQ